jgi:hypothetical protein
MNQRKAKGRRASAKKRSTDPEQKQIARLFECACAEGRKEEEGMRRERQKCFPKPKPIKRDLSQINFQAQHWWREAKYWDENSENMSIEEEKAAMWYEAVRRRPKVQQAWLEGKFLFGDNGWQAFSTWVVLNLPLSWPELDPMSKRGIIEASYSPWSVPPEGFSTFPTDKAEQKKVSMQVLRLPEPNDPEAAQRFVEHARRFADSGFIIAAVDKKQNQAVRAACEAIEALPPTFRTVDLKQEMFHHLPPDISDADRQALAEKQRRGTLTDQDFDELWHKYIKPASSLNAPWNNTAEVRARVLHKRPRKGKLIEEKQFNFESICHQLEAFDNGTISDFVNVVRL